MDISQDLNSHFKRFHKYITPNCIIYYDKKDYDNYMKNYPKVLDLDNSIHSKK